MNRGVFDIHLIDMELTIFKLCLFSSSYIYETEVKMCP